MQTALQAFTFDASAIRTLTIVSQPWFVAADVAAILGFRKASDMVRNLDEDEKGAHIVRTLGGDQEVTIISESGLYNSIFRSRRPEAQRFRKWVTSEVLPAIRKTGAYGSRGADDTIAAVELVREARELHGKAAAKRIWAQLNLPSPRGGAIGGEDWIDPLQELLEPWLMATPEPVSIDDVVEALALHQSGPSVRRRLGRLLRSLGRESLVVRRGDRVTLMFRINQPLLTREG